jgi:hypothetical protein
LSAVSHTPHSSQSLPVSSTCNAHSSRKASTATHAW